MGHVGAREGHVSWHVRRVRDTGDAWRRLAVCGVRAREAETSAGVWGRV